MAAAAARYDRPSIFRDAWARARQAAAAAAECVRLHIGAGMRAAWACAKAALGAPAKPAAPVVPVQLDLIEFIASLPPVVAAPVAPAAPASPRRFEHDGYVTAYTRLNADGEYLVDVYSRQPGSDVLIGQVEVYPIDFSGADAVLREALRAIEEARQAMATPVVQQPEPQETEESRLTARLAEMERERDELRADFLAARRERMAIVAGDMEGDAGIAWTNEDRAQADYDEAVERYEEAYQDLWRFTDIAA